MSKIARRNGNHWKIPSSDEHDWQKFLNNQTTMYNLGHQTNRHEVCWSWEHTKDLVRVVMWLLTNTLGPPGPHGYSRRLWLLIWAERPLGHQTKWFLNYPYHLESRRIICVQTDVWMGVSMSVCHRLWYLVEYFSNYCWKARLAKC